MPESKAAKQLPPELPQEYRDFVECKRDTLEFPPGAVAWAKVPGMPDGLQPQVTFTNAGGGKVRITVTVPGYSLETEISVSKRGNLQADTSKWPTEAPLVGDDIKELAEGLRKWIDDLNADLRKNGKKLGPISVKDGKLVGSKVSADTRSSMVQPGGGTMRGFVAPGVGAVGGTALVALSAWALLSSPGAPPPTDPDGSGLAAVGDPIAISGTLASTDLDFEVLDDVSSELAFEFPATGGLVDGTAQIVYLAQSSSGVAFTNTSDLVPWGAFDPIGSFLGYATHEATGEANGQTQTQTLSPMELGMIADPVTGIVSGAFLGEGFSYPVTGSAGAPFDPGSDSHVSRDGSADASALERSDANFTVTGNDWTLFLYDGGGLTGAGVLGFGQEFTSDAFGAGCTFDGNRAFTVDGTVDPDSGELIGTANVLAWGTPSETCTFETGVAQADSTLLSGTLDFTTGQLEGTIEGDDTVGGPFPFTATFDPDYAGLSSGGAGGVDGGTDAEGGNPWPIVGLVGGLGLAGVSVGYGLKVRRDAQSASAAPDQDLA